uniref:hypothetical protein n=1 Tax=Parabacteroides distasonis TaxID=823 RepID=UPI004025E693
MALTEADINQVLEAIKAESKSVESLETVGSLSGVSSLPAQKGDKLVSVPITLLSKPSDDAAARANQAAETVEEIAVRMNEAIGAAEEATGKTVAAIQAADSSADDAREAAREAREAIAGGYKHIPLSEGNFEALPEKDDMGIYLLYEEE